MTEPTFFAIATENKSSHGCPPVTNTKITVIKVGTGILTRLSDGKLDGGALVRLVTALAELIDAGRKPVLVSSGAVGAGVSAFGLTSYPQDLVTKQACAAVGQARLMHNYDNLFANFGIAVAQVLLTGSDLRTAERRNNVKLTLERVLQEPRVLPIINENDSVSVKELTLGDNDMLSAKVASLLRAESLVLLTSVDGLIEPETNKMISEVDDVDSVMSFATDKRGRFSIGGMASKLKAVRFAVNSGVETHIAHGRKPERLERILAGEAGFSTRFTAQL